MSNSIVSFIAVSYKAFNECGPTFKLLLFQVLISVTRMRIRT